MWKMRLTYGVPRYMLLVELPLFAKNGLNMDMKMNTVISCVPFFANWIFSIIYSKTLDHVRAKVRRERERTGGGFSKTRESDLRKN